MLRQTINVLDSELIDILSKRMEISDKIGEYKKDNKVKILQTTRWNKVLTRGIKEGEEKGLSKDFIAKILSNIHIESIDRQNNIMN